MTMRRAELGPNADEEDAVMVKRCCYCSDPQIYLCDHVDIRVCNRRLCARHAQVLDNDNQYCLEHKK
jgi:hypothetical protein